MATLTPHSVVCQGCGARVYGAVTERINAERTPGMVENLLDGRFQRFDCRVCGRAGVVDNELLYLDLTRKHWVGMFPPARRPEQAALGAHVERCLDEALAAAPPALARTRAEFLVRVVFGVAELREKVMAWHAGLDDAVLEILKLDLMAQQAVLVARGMVGLVLDGILADSTLLFRPQWAEPGQAEREPVVVSVGGAAYVEARAAWPELRAAHAALAAGPYVSIRRYLWPRADAAEHDAAEMAR
jgi:hypothetical protein